MKKRRLHVCLVPCLLVLVGAVLSAQNSSEAPVASGSRTGPATGPAPDTLELSLPRAIDLAREAGPAALRIDAERTIAVEQFRSAQASIRYGLDASLSATHAGSLTDPDARPSDSLGVSLSSSGGRGSVSLSSGLQAPTGIFDPDGSLRTSATTLSGTYTIWDGVPGGRAQASLEQSRLALEARMLTVDGMYTGLEDEVADAWFTLEGALRVIRVRELSLERRQDESQRTAVLRSVGEAHRPEELRSRIHLLDAEEALRTARYDVAVASRRLSRLLGLPADTTIVPIPETASTPASTIPQSFEEAMARAERNRVEFASRRTAEAQSAIERRGIEASRSPELRSSASLSVPGTPPAEPEFNLNYSLGVTLSVPISDRGRHESEMRRFEERQLLDRLAFEETVENIRREVGAAVSALEAARHRLLVSELELELAEAQHERAQLEYEDGSIGRIDLLTESVAITSAQIARERARTDVVLAERAVLRAVGE